MVEMELNKILIDEKRPEQLLVLKEKKGNRVLPIVVGIAEASSIRLKLSGFKPPRPMTHDLIKSIIDTLDIKFERVVIDKLENNTFYAKLYLKTPQGESKVIDSRPSDSIALAVRTNTPLFVEESVLERAQLG